MRTYLVISQLIYVLAVVPWIVFWGLSFMSFDNGFSAQGVTFVVSLGLYPLAVLVCSVLAWVYRRRKARFAALVNLIPLIWFIGIGVLFAVAG